MFGSDICTCRPYLIYGIEEAVKEAQKGGSGGKYTRFHFTTLIFKSVCIFRSLCSMKHGQQFGFPNTFAFYAILVPCFLSRFTGNY